MKLLLDTNIAIALEDPVPVDKAVAAFAQACERNGLQLFVADPNYDDVARDQDRNRRSVTLSKLGKYPRLRDVQVGTDQELAERFGTIESLNDQSDVRLLGHLALGVVDFLISEDVGLRKRATKSNLGSRVLRVEDALQWIKQSYEPSTVELPYIDEVPAYTLDIRDSFFDSLRTDYPGFDDWFRQKCVAAHRPCWIVRLDNRLAGLVIRKEERTQEADCTILGTKILKISTFKMAPDFHGEKFGEQLLKKVLWWAQANRFEVVYLTAFPKQEFLIDLLVRYGFNRTKSLDNGEVVLERKMYFGQLPDTRRILGPVQYNRVHYPRFYSGEECRKFCVPIRPEYHAKLFPEIATRHQFELFEEVSRIPGNTIQKVYLCRSRTTKLREGDLLFFYMSKDAAYVRSQSLTSVGVLERVHETHTLDELVHVTAKRSVFSMEELANLVQDKPSPVRVLEFLLVEHIEPPIALDVLLSLRVFDSHPPQAIMKLHPKRSAKLLEHLCSRGMTI